MSDNKECELVFYADEDTYEKAEKMAKELGLKTIGEFAVYAMRYYMEKSKES